MQKTLGKSGLFLFLRLGIALFLLLILVRMVDFHEMALTLGSVQAHLLPAALTAMLFNYCLKTYRWALILWVQRPDISLAQIARFNFVAIFLGNFLPTNLSADLVRIYYISRTADSRAALSSILADRIVGNFAVAIATVFAFLILRETGLFQIGSILSFGIVACLILSMAAPWLLQHTFVISGMAKIANRFSEKALFRSLQHMSDQLLLYRKRPGVIAIVLTLAVLNIFVVVFEFYFIARSFSTPISISYFFLFIPLLIYLTMLPLSVGGIGLMEGGFVFFFSKVGMPVATCLSIALVFRALQLACALPGAMVYLLRGMSSAEVPAKSTW
jgi:glycosyltransferase 2 family protein